MVQSLHIGLHWPFTNQPFGICAIYFDLKVNVCPKFKPPKNRIEIWYMGSIIIIILACFFNVKFDDPATEMIAIHWYLGTYSSQLIIATILHVTDLPTLGQFIDNLVQSVLLLSVWKCSLKCLIYNVTNPLLTFTTSFGEISIKSPWLLPEEPAHGRYLGSVDTAEKHTNKNSFLREDAYY